MPGNLSDLRGLELILTAGCNLRCSYCYQNDKKNRRIAWDVVRVALDRLLASTRSEVNVLFVGGEPLLEFPTIERAVEYLAEHKRPDMVIRYSIFTNGLLLGHRETQFLIERGFHVQLSFDGVPQAQQLRGENTFRTLDALVDKLREYQPHFYANHFRVSLTLVPATLPWLADSVEYFVLKKQLRDLVISPQFTAATDWRHERYAELDRAFARIFDICLQRFRDTGEVPLATFRKGGATSIKKPGAIPMCGAGRGDNLAVDVDGQAHGCLTFVGSYQTFPTAFLRSRVEAMRLGDVRDSAFESRLKMYPAAAEAAEIFHHKEEKYSSYGRCGECEYLDECSVCPMSIGRTEGECDPRRVPDFTCAYNLVSLRYRARFPHQRSLLERLSGPATVGTWTAFKSERT
jgi:sulfatase maturation enzyme AslB (radical SAM superfamily)